MNYQNGKVYKIVNDVNDEIYIGCSCQALSKRMTEHRRCASLNSQRTLYQAMNRIGIEHFKIVLVEECTAQSREQLRAREDHYIRTLKPTMNMCNAIRDKDYHQIYKLQNKDKIKEYYNNNKDKAKVSYTTNKDKIRDRKREQYTCSCGAVVNRSSKARHERTKSHTKHNEESI